jgi:DNA-binding NarL/FixJ family response regulator
VAAKRILLVSQYPLFDAGLNAMLESEPGLEIVGVCRGDTDEIAERALALQAEVILVLSRPGEAPKDATRLLEDVASCLIKVELDQNAVRIFRRHELHDYGLDDVVTAILANC